MPTPKKRTSGPENAEKAATKPESLSPGQTRAQGSRQTFDHNGDPIETPTSGPAADPTE